MVDTLRAQSAQCKVEGASQHHKIRPKGQSTQDVQSAFNATVKDQGQFGCCADRRQCFDRGGCAVKLATCVVGNPYAINAHALKACGILGAQHAFDQKFAVPFRA